MPTRSLVFVDQVGSTQQLASLGDEAGRAVRAVLLGVLREAVATHGGREVDSAGDGLFCVFEGAGEAVDAAVAMQQAVWSVNQSTPAERRLGVRVGIETGEPLRGPGGSYVGVAVVVASRLCASAGEGQILVSDVVRALVEPRGQHVFAAAGALPLKGVPTPVAASTVGWSPPERERVLPGELRTAAQAPFVGRDLELGMLRAAWERTREGEPGLVLVSGDRGAGATRLVAELAHQVGGGGGTVWYGRATAPESRFAAWAEALTGWLSEVPRADLRVVLAGAGSNLQRLSAEVRELVPEHSTTAPVPSAADPYLVADGLVEALSRWSRREPVLVVLDHLEDADAETLTVLRRVVESARLGRVLCVGCHVPPAVGTSAVDAVLGSLTDVLELRLSGLERSEVAELLRRVTGERPSEQRTAAVLAESEGNPYFVVAMALAQRERTLTESVAEAVGRAEGLRLDLRLQREEIGLGLRQLEQVRSRTDERVEGLVEPDGTPPADVACPYRGLVTFEPDDAEDFCGRDALVGELVARLASSAFLAVVGPSGSGKSSAVRAGLLPSLAAGALPGSAGWLPVLMTPGPDPVRSLAAALSAAVIHRATGKDDGAASTATLEARLVSEPLTVVCADAAPARRVVLVVDQAEELWTTAVTPRRDRVLELLTSAAASSGGELLVVLALRADYYGHAAAHPELAALLTESQVLVGPLTDAELRAVVEQPSRRARLVLEPGLAQAVVDDAKGQPGALPLVSTALLETWHRRRGRSLTLAGYAESGGVRGAIAHLADHTYDELSDQDRVVARRLLLRLAAPDQDGGDVARRVPLAELGQDAAVQRVLRRLVDRRLLTLGADSVHVAHEALLREWPRLRKWLDADREGRRMQQQVSRAALEWEGTGRDDEALLRGVRLAAAVEWRSGARADAAGAETLTATEREFLDASRRRAEHERVRQRRSVRRLRRLVAGLVALVLLAGVAAYVAADQRVTARANAQTADARRLAAQALLEERVDLSLLLAAQGVRLDDNPDTRAGLLSVLRRSEPLVAAVPTGVDGIGDLAVSPDGRTGAITSGDGIVVIDLHDRERTATLPTRAVDGLAFSPDGTQLAASSPDGVHVYATADLSSPPTTLRVPLFGSALGFTADGRRLVVAGTPRGGDGWGASTVDVGASRAVVELLGGGRVDHPRAVVRLDTGELLISAGVGSVLVDRTGSRVVRSVPPAAAGTSVEAVSVSPDGSLLAASGAAGLVSVLDAATGRQLGVAPGHRGSVSSLVWSPDGSRFVTASDDGSVAVWSAQPLARERDLDGHGSPVVAVAFSPDGRQAHTAASDGSLLTWDVGGQAGLAERVPPPPPPEGRRGAVFPTRFLAPPAGQLLAVDSVEVPQPDGRLEVHDALRVCPRDDAGCADVVHRFDGQVNALSASDTGDRILVETLSLPPMAPPDDDADGPPPGLEGSPVADGPPPGSGEPPPDPGSGVFPPEEPRSSWTLLDGRGQVVARRRSAPGTSHLLSPDGTVVAEAEGPVVQLWDAESMRPGDRFDLTGEGPAGAGYRVSAFSRDGTQLVLARDGGSALVLDVRSGRVLETLGGDGDILVDVAFSPDGSVAAAGTASGEVLLWDTTDWSLRGRPLVGHSDAVLSVDFSPDGRRLVTAGRDDVLLWTMDRPDVDAQRLREGSRADAQALFLSPDAVLTAAEGGGGKVWPVDVGTWLRRACTLAGRELTGAEWRRALGSREQRSTCGS